MKKQKKKNFLIYLDARPLPDLNYLMTAISTLW